MGWMLFFCIIVFAGAVYNILKNDAWNKANKTGKFFLVILLLGSTSSGIYFFISWNKNRYIEEVKAKIFEINTSDDVRRGTMSFFVKGLEIEEVLFADGKNDLLAFAVIDGEPTFYFIMYDYKGYPIAVAEEDEVTLYSDDYEYNNSDTGFELVTKGKRKVIVQIDMDGGVLNFQGFVLAEDGTGTFTQPFDRFKKGGDDKIYGGFDVNFIRSEKDYMDVLNKDNTIKRLYRYPRETHLGERVSR